MFEKEIERIKKEIQSLKDSIQINELSNDSYYLSWQYKRDNQRKWELEEELKKLEK